MVKTKVAIVVVPLTAQGHLNQLLHFSRLVSAYNIPIHFVSTKTHVRQAKSRIQGWNPNSISDMNFQEFDISHVISCNPSPDPDSKLKFPSQLVPSMKASITQLREHVYSFVNNLSSICQRIVVVYDSFMAYTVQDVCTVSNAELYCFHSISAFSVYSFRWQRAGKPNEPHPEAAGVIKEIPSWEGCFSPEFEQILNLMKEAAPKYNHGDIYNTSRVTEGLYLDLLAKENNSGTDKIWALGPFHPLSLPEKSKNGLGKRNICLEWLDDQEPDSVIFVSFGSTTSLSDEELKEIALGLERSRQKFIWVLRDADKGDVFDGEVRRVALPLGFEERVKGRGLVVREWAPQLEILGHSSTGGFISHCGWNSSIESICNGVPIASWPMHSDQPTNAVLITKVLKIGLKLKDWNCRDEVVSSSMIEEVVRRLMASPEGDERKRAKALAGDIKMSSMENGITRPEISLFIEHVCR